VTYKFSEFERLVLRGLSAILYYLVMSKSHSDNDGHLERRTVKRHDELERAAEERA
jgi:hypothetical protein